MVRTRSSRSSGIKEDSRNTEPTTNKMTTEGAAAGTSRSSRQSQTSNENSNAGRKRNRRRVVGPLTLAWPIGGASASAADPTTGTSTPTSSCSPASQQSSPGTTASSAFVANSQATSQRTQSQRRTKERSSSTLSQSTLDQFTRRKTPKDEDEHDDHPRREIKRAKSLSSASFAAATTTSSQTTSNPRRQSLDAKPRATTTASEPPKRRITSIQPLNHRSVTHSSDDSNRDCRLWIDKYCPRTSEDLVVAPKRVREVKEWLERVCACDAARSGDSSSGTSFRPVLSITGGVPADHRAANCWILAGNPGTGKSTMVQVLAEELQIPLLEWSESFYQYQRQQFRPTHAALQVETVTPLNSFADFLQSASMGYATLATHNNFLSQPASTQPESQSFSQRSTSRQNPEVTKQEQYTRNCRPLILIDELPYCHDEEARTRLRQLLTDHVERSRVATLWVYSQVVEGKLHVADLEVFLEPHVLYEQSAAAATISGGSYPATQQQPQSPYVRIVNVNGATLARMHKCLTNIVQQEVQNKGRTASGTAGKRRKSTSSSKSSTSSLWSKEATEELHRDGSGDIRHAIHALQFHFARESLQLGSNRSRDSRRGGPTGARTGSSSASTTRDVRLSCFHALGKLLYAKRKQPNSGGDEDSSNLQECKNNNDSERPPLDFDPEVVLEQSQMELPGSLEFLQYHSLDFCTDISELSEIWDCYADAAYLLDQAGSTPPSMRGTTSSSGPSVAAASLAGRSLARYNNHPTPKKFRSLGAPNSFRVLRQRRENQRRLQQFVIRSAAVTNGATRSLDAITTDLYPYWRLMSRHPRNFGESSAVGLPQLDSFFDSSSASRKTSSSVEENEEAQAQAYFHEQTEILEEDDIDDFLSEGDDEVEIVDSNGTRLP